MDLHSIAGAVLILFLDDLAPGSSLLGAGALAVFLGATLDAPVEDVVVLVTLTNKEITEELAEVRIVRLVVEAKSTSVVEEDAKLVGESAAQKIRRGGHLLLHNAVVLLLLGGGFETLPGQGATQEVHQHVGERLKVIATSLLDTQVSVDGGVAGCTSEILVLTVGDVKVGLGVAELLSETEIDNVDLVATLADAHQEIVGLDVTVDEVARVDVFDAGDLTRTIRNGTRKTRK